MKASIKRSAKTRARNEFWEDVKTVAVLDDKLVVTTKGDAPETSL